MSRNCLLDNRSPIPLVLPSTLYWTISYLSLVLLARPSNHLLDNRLSTSTVNLTKQWLVQVSTCGGGGWKEGASQTEWKQCVTWVFCFFSHTFHHHYQHYYHVTRHHQHHKQNLKIYHYYHQMIYDTLTIIIVTSHPLIPPTTSITTPYQLLLLQPPPLLQPHLPQLPQNTNLHLQPPSITVITTPTKLFHILPEVLACSVGRVAVT